MMLGHSNDHHFDFGHDTSEGGVLDAHDQSDHDFKILSLQSILAFLMGFGWMGKAMLEEWHLNIIASLTIALLFGITLLFFSAFLMKMVFKLNHNYTPKLDECLKSTGTVYINIPAKGEGGSGQVEILFGGRMAILDAKSTPQTQEDIPSGKSVRVVDIRNNNLIVQLES